MKPPRLLAAAVARRVLMPLVPARRRLPFEFRLRELEGALEPELLYLDDFISSTDVAIDVGAGMGLFTYALSRRFKRVYAFDADPALTGLIEMYNPGNIELVFCGLSSAQGAGPAPNSRGTATATLDSFQISGAGFIRIDVGGSELDVLEGAAKTIEASRPIVLVELKREDIEQADAFFRDFDYKRCRLEEFNEVFGYYLNHIFVPLERLAKFGIARPVE
jgi:precorrin-6B methylase 2